MNLDSTDIAIARNIMRLLDEWGLDGKQIIQLLALPKTTRTRHLDKFRNGDAFPSSDNTTIRVEHIAGIAEALRTTFPRNAHMGPRWLRTPHRRFRDQTPIDTMLKGDIGLSRVRAELDCSYAWDKSGS